MHAVYDKIIYSGISSNVRPYRAGLFPPSAVNKTPGPNLSANQCPPQRPVSLSSPYPLSPVLSRYALSLSPSPPWISSLRPSLVLHVRWRPRGVPLRRFPLSRRPIRFSFARARELGSTERPPARSATPPSAPLRCSRLLAGEVPFHRPPHGRARFQWRRLASGRTLAALRPPPQPPSTGWTRTPCSSSIALTTPRNFRWLSFLMSCSLARMQLGARQDATVSTTCEVTNPLTS